jgi:HK97 family phage major capsid protein
MNLIEIEKRMVELREEISKEDADLNVIETELNNLKEEKRALIESAEKREKLLEDVSKNHTVIKEKKEERKNMDEMNKAPEYRSAWLKSLQGKELNVEERAVITAAAAVIPQETFKKIVEKLEQTSVVYPFVSKSEIPGYLRLPRENSKNDADWLAVGTAATDKTDSFDYVDLSAYKLIKTIEIGADVALMSIDSFENFIINALAKKLARAVDNGILKGTSSSQPTGLLKSGEITNTGTFTKAGMTHADLMVIIGDIGAEYRKNASFVMNSALFFGDVVPALAAKGIGVDTQDPLKFRVAGFPVIISDLVDDDTLIFGDLSYYHFNWAAPVEIKADLSVGFRNGSTVYRGMALADGKPLLAEAFNKYTRALA